MLAWFQIVPLANGNYIHIVGIPSYTLICLDSPIVCVFMLHSLTSRPPLELPGLSDLIGILTCNIHLHSTHNTVTTALNSKRHTYMHMHAM